MNALKAKATIHCNTCGCTMKRQKTIKVNAETKEEAMVEAKEKATEWRNSLSGANCRTCASIIKDMAA